MTDKKQIKTFYWDIANETLMGKYLTKIEQTFINSIFEKNNIKILDIGGGSGRFAVPLSQMGIDITVIDPGLPGIESLKSKNSNVNIIIGRGEQLPFKQKTFDIILAVEMLEYLENKEQFLFDCTRLLKNSGSLVFTFSNRASYKRFHPNIIKQPQLYGVTYNEIKRILKNTGCVIEKSCGFNWIPFKRHSNNPLIPLCAFLENVFGLRYIPSHSPWVIIASRKAGNFCL